MTYISYNNLWESDFHKIVLRKDKLQDLFSSQLELQVHDSYKGDEKITTNFEPVNNEDVINKTYLDEKCEKKMVIYHHWKKITTNLKYLATNNQLKRFWFKEQ